MRLGVHVVISVVERVINIVAGAIEAESRQAKVYEQTRLFPNCVLNACRHISTRDLLSNTQIEALEHTVGTWLEQRAKKKSYTDF